MNVTSYGHSCFAVNAGGRELLFDPYIKPNPFAKAVDIKKVRADYMLISHGHDDHIADAVAIAKRTKATVIANYEVAEWLKKKGLSKVHGMNPGGSFDFEFGRVKSIPAIHSSSLPNGSYGGSPGGFLIESRDGNFYYSGDTALSVEMKLITAKLKFAVLCIGGNFTMDAKDALQAARFIRCDQIMGVHYDTFPEIKINHSQAQQTFKAAGKTLHLLCALESREFK